jgi:hypothetical protein
VVRRWNRLNVQYTAGIYEGKQERHGKQMCESSHDGQGAKLKSKSKSKKQSKIWREQGTMQLPIVERP